MSAAHHDSRVSLTVKLTFGFLKIGKAPGGNAYTIIKSRVLIQDYGYCDGHLSGKGEMTLFIKLVLPLSFFCIVAPRSTWGEEILAENSPEPETGMVSRSVVEEPPESVRTVQIPVFKNGRWNGYREEVLEPERKPTSVTTEVNPPETPEANGPQPDETGKPYSTTPSP